MGIYFSALFATMHAYTFTHLVFGTSLLLLFLERLSRAVDLPSDDCISHFSDDMLSLISPDSDIEFSLDGDHLWSLPHPLPPYEVSPPDLSFSSSFPPFVSEPICSLLVVRTCYSPFSCSCFRSFMGRHSHVSCQRSI